MAAQNLSPYANKFKFGRGVPAFNPRVNGVLQGYRPLGNCPGFEITIEGETFNLPGFESGISETVYTVPLGITRSATITTNNADKDNLSLFIAGESVTIVQDSTPVTGEVIGGINPGNFYQLGATVSNPSGIRGVSSVAVRVAQGDDAPDRVNATAYDVGDFYVPATPNSHYYLCTADGTSAGSPPTFSTAGATFADGTATFLDMGLVTVPSTADVHYRIASAIGSISINKTGAIATAAAAYGAAVPGAKLSLSVDYTPAANTRTQIRTGGEQSVTGELRFIADNPGDGENEDLYCPQVTITPNGSLPFITGDTVAEFGFTVGIGVRDSQTRAMYIDGRGTDI